MVKELDRETLVREKKKIAFLSVVLNLFLALLKLGAGFLSGSASLVADGIHSFADLAASISVFAGITIANIKNKEFPYGLYKVENLISLVSAFAIFFAGYEIVRDVLFENELTHIKNLPLALGAVLITMALTFLYSRWERKKGEELNSPSLIADAEHIKTDFLSTLVVLAGILGNYFGYPWIEKLAVLIIVALIFHAGWEIAVEALKVLLDATVDKETLDEVKNIMESHPLVEKVKYLTGRSSGSYKFLEAEIVLKTTDFNRAHNTVHELEREIKKKVPFIERLVIHFEPPEHREKTFALLLDENGEICKTPESCKRVEVYRLKKGRLEKVANLEIDKKLTLDRGSCAELFERLADLKVDCFISGKLFFGKGALYVAAYYNIELGLWEGGKDELIKLLKKGETSFCFPPKPRKVKV